MDRGMVSPDTLTMIQERGYHYLVATRKGERDEWLDDFEKLEDWVAVERQPCLIKGCMLSWPTVREILSTHQVRTVVLETPDGRVLKIRNGCTPEPHHKKLYEFLDIPSKVMKPIRRWVIEDSEENNDEKNTTSE